MEPISLVDDLRELAAEFASRHRYAAQEVVISAANRIQELEQPTTEPIRSALTPKDEEGHSADKGVDVEVERAAFESWAKEKKYFVEIYESDYEFTALSFAWKSWLGRAGLSSHPKEQAEPVAFMWQHEETGRTGFTDAYQLKNGFAENNPRLKIVASLYAGSHPIQPAPAEPTRQELQKEGNHPAPCARFCEATSFNIEIRSLKSQLVGRAPEHPAISEPEPYKKLEYAEFLSKRLGRVARLVGYPMPLVTDEEIAAVAPVILGGIASRLERQARNIGQITPKAEQS